MSIQPNTSEQPTVKYESVTEPASPAVTLAFEYVQPSENWTPQPDQLSAAPVTQQHIQMMFQQLFLDLQ